MKKRKSQLSGRQQETLIEHFVSGSTARCASRLIGVNKNSAAYYFHRLRERIAYELERDNENILDGEMEVDERYVSGHRKGHRGRGARGKSLYLAC